MPQIYINDTIGRILCFTTLPYTIPRRSYYVFSEDAIKCHYNTTQYNMILQWPRQRKLRVLTRNKHLISRLRGELLEVFGSNAHRYLFIIVHRRLLVKIYRCHQLTRQPGLPFPCTVKTALACMSCGLKELSRRHQVSLFDRRPLAWRAILPTQFTTVALYFGLIS